MHTCRLNSVTYVRNGIALSRANMTAHKIALRIELSTYVMLCELGKIWT